MKYSMNGRQNGSRYLIVLAARDPENPKRCRTATKRVRTAHPKLDSIRQDARIQGVILQPYALQSAPEVSTHALQPASERLNATSEGCRYNSRISVLPSGHHRLYIQAPPLELSFNPSRTSRRS